MPEPRWRASVRQRTIASVAWPVEESNLIIAAAMTIEAGRADEGQHLHQAVGSYDAMSHKAWLDAGRLQSPRDQSLAGSLGRLTPSSQI